MDTFLQDSKICITPPPSPLRITNPPTPRPETTLFKHLNWKCTECLKNTVIRKNESINLVDLNIENKISVSLLFIYFTCCYRQRQLERLAWVLKEKSAPIGAWELKLEIMTDRQTVGIVSFPNKWRVILKSKALTISRNCSFRKRSTHFKFYIDCT